MLLRPVMKRLFCLKAKNGLGRFAPSALRHHNMTIPGRWKHVMLLLLLPPMECTRALFSVCSVFFWWSHSWSSWDWRERPVGTDADGTLAGGVWLRPGLWCRQGISAPPRWWSGMTPHTKYGQTRYILRTWYLVLGTWHMWYVHVCYIPFVVSYIGGCIAAIY